MSFPTLFKHIRASEGKADGGALFVVTTCLSIICLGLAFVGGNIPEKFPKANPRGAAAGDIISAPAKDTLQLLTFKAVLPKLIPTIDPNAPALSTDKQPTPPPSTGGVGTGPGEGQSGCTPAGPNDPEPPADYTRTTHGGKTVNQRTKVMLQTAERYAGTTFTLTQGSYSTGVGASAGTHDGGGAGDISVGGMSRAQIDNSIRGLRMAGFAAWYRTPAEGFGAHIHFEAIGDREMSPAGMDQVRDLFAGRNGLANNGPDTAPASIGRPFPAWAGKYGSCTGPGSQTAGGGTPPPGTQGAGAAPGGTAPVGGTQPSPGGSGTTPIRGGTFACGQKSTPPASTQIVSCTGLTATQPTSNGYYEATNFGCNIGFPKDPVDNCLPACSGTPECTGLSGRACEEKVIWYSANADQYGCNTKLKVTNPTTGKAVIVRALDRGPGCAIQKNRSVFDMSQAAYKEIGVQKFVKVEKVPESTPLGPIPVCQA